MGRKLKVLSTISALMICICMLMVGVYAARSISFKAVGRITFISDIVYANITRTVYGNKETVEPKVFGLEGKILVVNYLDVNKIPTTSNLTNNGDGTLTANGYPSTTNKTLKELCPMMKVGDDITFSMVTNGYNSLYFTNASTGTNFYWANGTNKVLTEEMLNSVMRVYKQTQAQGNGSATISEMQFVKTSDYLSKLKGAGENGANLFIPYNEKHFVSVQRKNLFNYKSELVTAGGVPQGDGSVKITKSSSTETTLLSWSPTKSDVKRLVVTATMKNDHATNGATVYFKITYKDGGVVTSANCTNCNNAYQTFTIQSAEGREVKSVDWVSISAGSTYIKDVQIEDGVEATSYEAYQEPITLEKEYLTENKTIEGNQLNFIDASTDIIVQFEIENLSVDRGIKVTIKDLLEKVTGEAISKKIMVKVGDQALREYNPNLNDNQLEVLQLVCTNDTTTNNHKAVIQIVFTVQDANIGAQINYNYLINMVNVPAENPQI